MNNQNTDTTKAGACNAKRELDGMTPEKWDALSQYVSNETGDGLEAYLLKRRPFCARCVTLNKATQALQGETYCDHHAERERHEIEFRRNQREQERMSDPRNGYIEWLDRQGD